MARRLIAEATDAFRFTFYCSNSGAIAGTITMLTYHYRRDLLEVVKEHLMRACTDRYEFGDNKKSYAKFIHELAAALMAFADVEIIRGSWSLPVIRFRIGDIGFRIQPEKTRNGVMPEFLAVGEYGYYYSVIIARHDVSDAVREIVEMIQETLRH